MTTTLTIRIHRCRDHRFQVRLSAPAGHFDTLPEPIKLQCQRWVKTVPTLKAAKEIASETKSYLQTWGFSATCTRTA